MQASITLEAAARRFMEREQRRPAGIEELVRSGYLKNPPDIWLEGDSYILLPDGSCRSAVLARQTVAGMILRLKESIASYRKKLGVLPPDLNALVRAKRLRELPVHPLAALGYGFVYHPATGEIAESVPPRR